MRGIHHLLWIACVLRPQVLSWQPSQPSFRPSTSLLAKKAGSKNQKKSTSGGGFGAPSSKGPDLSSKLRSVSGQHAGAGSKVLRKAANTFDALRKEHGKENCYDVYLRSPLNSPTIFWFVGKVAVDPSRATGKEAVIAQKRLILEYAKTQLRPQNFGGKYANNLDLWLAPGDSEMDVVQNKISLEAVTGSASDLREDFDVSSVGLNPEIYIGDEVHQGGLRVERDENGKPNKPVFEINESA